MVLFFCLTTLQNWQNCPAALTNHSGFLSIQLGFFRTSRGGANIELLCQRKQDTMKNLANEFHVSLRTICYDIDELARNYPIVTIRGKYKDGVKIADGYRLDRKYLNPEQQHLLKRLSKTLSGEDRNIMESILRDFTLKEASEAAPGC